MGNLNYNLNFETLCTKYELGHLKNEPEQVTGGLLHRMYRLQTDKALYAVKALNPQIISGILPYPTVLFQKKFTDWCSQDYKRRTYL
ncbi:hypothetical protein [Paenibacillus pseudetheri]|uniref:Uncharacterized protein n=1 Tax=Paenibacillus pseudetheri TaxID=2897682 RepID=A0ABN8FHR2_9BACL|nr:hypothetical protein [Paenibacillus pseudetheri]CAH1054986.1 hypothetical protein PAECIP111894_01136 [Paenibacillus pseudetheri]